MRRLSAAGCRDAADALRRRLSSGGATRATSAACDRLACRLARRLGGRLLLAGTRAQRLRGFVHAARDLERELRCRQVHPARSADHEHAIGPLGPLREALDALDRAIGEAVDEALGAVGEAA